MMSPASSKINAISPGSKVFIDSTIFVYHFTGASAACRTLLERCEVGEVRAATSTLVLAEVTHRLMTIEAVTRGLVSPPGVVRKLRERPAVVRRLRTHSEAAERIPLMNVDVLPVDLATVLRASAICTRWGLLTNDSFVVSSCLGAGIEILASADRDFRPIEGLRVHEPGDLG